MQTTINQRIALLSAEHGTQEQFSQDTSLSRSAVSNYIKGVSKPNAEALIRIASAIPNLNCRWLLTGEGDMYGPSSELHQLRVILEQIHAKQSEC